MVVWGRAPWGRAPSPVQAPQHSGLNYLLLYYITDRTQFADDESIRRRCLLEKIGEAARFGADYIQLREKDLVTRDLESLAGEAVGMLRDLAKQESRTASERQTTRLLINSRTDVAIACGAGGVHLRSDDILPSQARKIWNQDGRGNRPIVSVSCHSVEEVRRAASEGADFALFAPVFGKGVVSGAGLEALRQACQEGIQVLALGGITMENAQTCVEAGAAGIAGIRLFQQNNIGEVIAGLRGSASRADERT